MKESSEYQINEEILDRMRLQGDSLEKPRDINFSIVFKDLTKALEFSNCLNQRNTLLSCDKPVQYDEGWEVTATFKMKPNLNAISRMEQWLAESAAPFGGENDGWGCFSLADPSDGETA
jgi:hypothetical protein